MSPERTQPASSRADQLRQKRQQSSQERVSTARQQSARAGQTTTHTTVRRTSPYATPNMQDYRKSAATRKVYYASAGNGVEIRMPSLPMIRMNWQIGAAVFAVVLLALVLLLVNLDLFQVKLVEVRGLQRVTAADVQAVVDNNNGSLFLLDRQKTINAVEIAFPELTDVQLKVVFPNKVIVSAKERQPILAWVSGKTTKWISADGVIMPVRGDAGTLPKITSKSKVPTTTPTAKVTSAIDFMQQVITQKSNAEDPADTIQHINPEILTAAISLSSQMPSGASLIYDSVSGMGWNDPRGWQAYFGVDFSNLQFKQTEYETIVARLKTLGITPKLISVAFSDAPYYRTE